MNWINIDDQLPEQYQQVLTYGSPNDGGFYIQHCEHSDGIFRFVANEKENKGIITHWMPLPISPNLGNCNKADVSNSVLCIICGCEIKNDTGDSTCAECWEIN